MSAVAGSLATVLICDDEPSLRELIRVSLDGENSRTVRSGLLARITVALGVLAAALVIVFAVLIVALIGLRDRSVAARHAQFVIARANALQTLVLDFESGFRGYAITGNRRYLDAWHRARRDYQKRANDLISLTADDPAQQQLARQINQSVNSYLDVYTPAFMEFLYRNPTL